MSGSPASAVEPVSGEPFFSRHRFFDYKNWGAPKGPQKGPAKNRISGCLKSSCRRWKWGGATKVLPEGNGKTQCFRLHDPVVEAVELAGTLPEKQNVIGFPRTTGAVGESHRANFETPESQRR
jgi:hypothetical protein